jgi:hypothetical protein
VSGFAFYIPNTDNKAAWETAVSKRLYRRRIASVVSPTQWAISRWSTPRAAQLPMRLCRKECHPGTASHFEPLSALRSDMAKRGCHAAHPIRGAQRKGICDFSQMPVPIETYFQPERVGATGIEPGDSLMTIDNSDTRLILDDACDTRSVPG